jgi:hypothetical protein
MFGAVFFLSILLFTLPFAIIFRRMGYSGWWALVGAGAFFALPWMAAVMPLRKELSNEEMKEIFR